MSNEHVHEGDHPHAGPRFPVVLDLAEAALLACAHGSSKLVNVQLEVTQADIHMNQWSYVEFFVESSFLESSHGFPHHLFSACVDLFKGTSTSG